MSNRFGREFCPFPDLEIGKYGATLLLSAENLLRSCMFVFVITGALLVAGAGPAFAQDNLGGISNPYTSNNPFQESSNYMARSTAFRQEIARFEINVVREGKEQMPITQVPRLQRDDVVKIHLLDEAINGIKPDQSGYDWTMIVAFINPSRNSDGVASVSPEIRFKKTGWYKDYSFRVPYDSQPVFFLYPKANYRERIVNLIEKNQDEIRKIGEKTIELASAYEKIGMFLNELQTVVYRNQYNQMYGNMYGAGYNPYGLGGVGSNPNGLPPNFMMDQMVERMAQSFNIALPSCWQSGQNGVGGIGYNPYNPYGMQQSFASRASCVAHSVRLEDLDISISKMIQEGGVYAAAQLAARYPQIAQWINVAAIAIDLYLKLSKRAPLRLIPTMVSNNSQGAVMEVQRSLVMQQGVGSTEDTPTSTAPVAGPAVQYNPVRISMYAESLPSDNNYVTAYPLVLNKWQANADPDNIALPIPGLMDACLHPGQNMLRSLDLTSDWTSDTYARDFKLELNSSNGYHKEFPLRKNIGLGAWELNLSQQDFDQLPRIDIPLKSMITGKRGFNDIHSPEFELPIPVPGKWEITPESAKDFVAGGKRTVVLKNQIGGCKCLQAVIYKPSVGGQYVFEANARQNALVLSENGREASFQLDAGSFTPGLGKLEIKLFSGETATLNLNLYPLPPEIKSLKVYRGEKRATVVGERLEQLRAIRVNGKRATVEGNSLQAVTADNGLGIVSESSQSTEALPKTSAVVEKTVLFDEPLVRQDALDGSIEMEVDGGRTYTVAKTFDFAMSRPALASNEGREVDGIATGDNVAIDGGFRSSVGKLPVFLIEPGHISVIAQNNLTDYDFKVENLTLETRLEDSQLAPSDLPVATLEVLDWKSLKVDFRIDEKFQRLLGGKRLQFRLRDRERGDSDWYTVKQRFVRIPAVTSVRCPADPKEKCELRGDGLEYIGQISIDGGNTWLTGLKIQPGSDGRRAIEIPGFKTKNLLQIKLRDFPAGTGLIVADYDFTAAGRTKK